MELPLRSGLKNHRENWAKTRPVSIPWMNISAMPGPSTEASLCVKTDRGDCGSSCIGGTKVDIILPLRTGASNAATVREKE